MNSEVWTTQLCLLPKEETRLSDTARWTLLSCGAKQAPLVGLGNSNLPVKNGQFGICLRLLLSYPGTLQALVATSKLSATVPHSAVTPHGLLASFFIISTVRGERQISATARTLSNRLLHHLLCTPYLEKWTEIRKMQNNVYSVLKPNHFRPHSSWQCTQKLGAEINMYRVFVIGNTITLITIHRDWLIFLSKLSATLPKYQMVTKSVRKHLMSLCSTVSYPSPNSDSDWTHFTPVQIKIN